MTAIYSTILGYLITINLIRAMAHKLWSSSTLRIFTLWVPLKRVPQRWIFMQNHSSQATLIYIQYDRLRPYKVSLYNILVSSVSGEDDSTTFG